MIQRIIIRNFAIIEDIEVQFHDGLDIVTGETGAGKSIVIEAMSLALGSRADTAFVRTGQEKATVQMVAELDGEEYIITREVSVNGRNLCKVNGEIVTLSQLSQLCRKLADIHGQYDHQSLLDPDEHIKLLDSYGTDLIGPARARVANAYSKYSEIRTRLSQLRSRLAEDMRQRDFIAFEYNELNKADLRAGEDEALEEEVAILQNSEQIYEDLAGAYAISEEGESPLIQGMKQVLDRLQSAGKWSDELAALAERMNGLYYEYEDLCTSIRENRDRAVFSPEDLDRAIGRLDLLSRLKQKHGKSIEELIEYRDELSTRLGDVSDAGEMEKALEKELSSAEEVLRAASGELSEARKKTAADLEKLISKELADLNFNDSRFSISFSDSDQFSAGGTDIVEFLISTNRGEDLKPLEKIASGGEMSRIMLAFKKIIGDYDGIPTMIFDEIDSGISGVTASIVGRKLREISKSHQIICITHLPQIAACGDHHYRISKSSDDEMTYTHVDELSQDERVEELARLLGGADVTETTLRSAKELLDRSKGSVS